MTCLDDVDALLKDDDLGSSGGVRQMRYFVRVGGMWGISLEVVVI